MFGLFTEHKLIGIVIIDYKKKFLIDDKDKKIETFYIQELIVEPSYRGKNYGKLLIDYCIAKCPYNIFYISLMTKPDNISLIKIAEKCGFKKQLISSGDPKHSLLMIYNKDKFESSLS